MRALPLGNLYDSAQSVKSERTGDRVLVSVATASVIGPRRKWKQYVAALGTFAAASLLNVWLEPWIGYQTIPLVYLLTVVVLALFVSRGPLLLGTTLTAFGWNFLFAPPKYSLHIGDFYDKTMFATYFVVAL